MATSQPPTPAAAAPDGEQGLSLNAKFLMQIRMAADKIQAHKAFKDIAFIILVLITASYAREETSRWQLFLITDNAQIYLWSFVNVFYMYEVARKNIELKMLVDLK